MNHLLPAVKDMPLPKNAAEVRRMMTMQRLKEWAKALGCESGFEQEQTHADFLPAFGNYDAALWRWVFSLAPPDVLDTVNAACFNLPDTDETEAHSAHVCIVKHEHLFRRAVYVAGMKKGEGFKPEHARHLASFSGNADRLDDKDLFETAKQHRWNWKKAQAKIGRTPLDRQLKYCLLISWLPRGLWRMSGEEQLDALKKLWPDLPSYSVQSIATAASRLGLRCFRPAPTNKSKRHC